MGKRARIPGVSRGTAKKQAEEIATRALLLGAKWDKTTSMLVRTTHSSNGPGMIPSYWEEFFDVNGNPLTQKEASARRKRANQKIKGRHGQIITPKNNYRASFSKWIISNKQAMDFQKSSVQRRQVEDVNDHMADSMRYMVDSMALRDTMKIMKPTSTVTTEIKA